MRENFAPKWRTDDEIEAIAQAFLSKHPLYASIPVDIDRIVQFDLCMDIVPIPGLKTVSKRSGLDIDAYISADFSSITIDQFIMMERQARYRFSLAHEIGHMVLHRNTYESFQFSSLGEWLALVSGIPKEKWDPFEYQANEFAGRLLVPRVELLQRHPAALQQAETQVQEDFPGLDVDFPELFVGRTRSIAIELLAVAFAVSTAAMEIRLRKERL